MRKMIALLLCAATLFAFAACGGSEESTPTDATASATEPAPTQAPTEAPADVAPEPAEKQELLQNAVLFDHDDAAFLVAKTEENEHLGMQLHVQCINKSDRTLMFSWDKVVSSSFEKQSASFVLPEQPARSRHSSRAQMPPAHFFHINQ